MLAESTVRPERDPAPLSRTRSGRRPGPVYTKGSILTTAILFVVGIYFLLPAWWLVVSSTKGPSSLYSSEGLWFGHFDLWRNLTGLFTYNGDIYLRWLLNTVLYAGVGALLATALSAAAGFALAKYEFRGRELIFSIILGGVLVPATALALPLYLLMSKVHLTDTYWSVFLPSIVSPFGVYLARIYASASVPDELLEAARLDGAGEFRTFVSIAARIMSPALVTIFLFQFVAIWNNFFLPLVMLSNQRLYPVTLGLYSWNDQYGQAPQLVSYVIIGALVSVIPLVIAFLSLQRFWRSGLTAGSVKL
ncbi:MAG TPA: carbohydrate ABC transporter permease [Acidimicrobiales bacterium]|nr:carbohydrate ABC transporter permease [Acidimicrobiales bacterium]